MSERSELIPVVTTTNPSPLADVIFVHGINADPRETWMTNNSLKGKRFPEECWLYWLGTDIPNVAVWTLGYPASAFGWKGFTMELESRADNITNYLLNHPGLERKRPIIFVTHSMGGLLVKHILRRAMSGDCPESNAEFLVNQTKGIVFLSTPHTGANLANFIERLAVLLPTVNVSELKRNEPELIKLNNWFHKNFDQLNLKARIFYEKQPTPIKKGLLGILFRKIVVDENSANLSVPGVSVIPLDANHSSICWVTNYQLRRENQLYSNILNFIEECLVNPQTAH